MTPHTTVPLLWDGDRFRPITDLPDLAEWGDGMRDAGSPERVGCN